MAVLFVAGGAPAAAAPVDVTPPVATLEAGPLPAIPYVDWPGREIVDGSRHVSIAGIQGRATTLHKVDGGYLLTRRTSDINNDMVFVSTSGARRVIISEWDGSADVVSLNPGVAVSHNGDKVLTNAAADIGGETMYGETRVLSLPSGKVLRRRYFGEGTGNNEGAGIIAFGVDRALVTTEDRTTKWWNPAKNTLTSINDKAFSGSADLTAWQWALTNRSTKNQFVRGIPPRTSPSWTVTPKDEIFGPWSPDDTKLVGLDKPVWPSSESTKYTVFSSANGERILTINGNFPARVSWESDSALLLRARIGGSDPATYQLIRCTLAGVCQKVGPSTTELEGSIIPATRRNS